MKNLLKITFALFLFMLYTDCSNGEETNQKDVSKLTDEEVFALKTFEIYEELSTKDIPIEDIKYLVFKNSNGFLTAKFELTGLTKKELQMGSFVKTQSRDGNEGTTCDSKWSCGKAIYNCLENDQDALISEGACAVQYCVTCQDP